MQDDSGDESVAPAMGQLEQDDTHAASGLAAGSLYAWHDTLCQARASLEVDLLACAAAGIMAQLGDCRTFEGLATRFQAPDDQVVTVLIGLYYEGGILCPAPFPPNR